MKEKVQAALDNYVLAYTNNDKELFTSLWAPDAIFEDPVGAELQLPRSGGAGVWG